MEEVDERGSVGSMSVDSVRELESLGEWGSVGSLGECWSVGELGMWGA